MRISVILLRKLSIIALLAMYNGPTWAGGDPGDISALRDLLQPVSSLSGSFKQRTADGEGFVLQESSGTFLLARPGKIRWISEKPLEQWVISDGETLWIYDPDLEQVTVQPFDQDLAATPATLFSDDLDELDRAFFVRRAVDSELTSFELTPEQGGGLFERITLQFKQGKPVGMSMRDTLGQQTSIAFDAPVINPPAEDTQFTFVIPDGIDVINNEP